MAMQTINLGGVANDGTGDDLRTGGDKINDNFADLDQRVNAVKQNSDKVPTIEGQLDSANQSIIQQSQKQIDTDNAVSQVEGRVSALESETKIPPGGTTGQAIVKNSDVSGDIGWGTIESTGGGSGGETTPVFPETRTMTLTKGLFGRYKNKTINAVTTTNVVMELETEFLSFKVGLVNNSSAAQAGIKVSVGRRFGRVSAAWLVDIEPDGGWEEVTFGGQPTATIPARKDTDVLGKVLSDTIRMESLERSDGSRRPLIMIRIEYPAGTVAACPYLGIGGWRSADNARYMAAAVQAVAGVTTKSAFTETLNTEQDVFIPFIQYNTTRAGKQYMLCGDSTLEGIQSYPNCFGPVQMSAYGNSTPDFPIEYFNAAVHSAYPSTYSRNMLEFMSIVTPTHVIYQPYSVNEAAPSIGIDTAARSNLKRSLGWALEGVRAQGKPVKMLLLEGIPVNTAGKALGAGDQTRRDINTWINNFTGPTIVTGYAAAITGARVDGQDQLKAELAAGDNLHPNADGYAALSNILTPYL